MPCSVLLLQGPMLLPFCYHDCKPMHRSPTSVASLPQVSDAIVHADAVPCLARLLQSPSVSLQAAACAVLYRLSRVHERFARVVSMSDCAGCLAQLLRVGPTGA